MDISAVNKSPSQSLSVLCCCVARLSPAVLTKWANIFSNVPFQQRFDAALALFWLHSAIRRKQPRSDKKLNLPHWISDQMAFSWNGDAEEEKLRGCFTSLEVLKFNLRKWESLAFLTFLHTSEVTGSLAIDFRLTNKDRFISSKGQKTRKYCHWTVAFLYYSRLTL